MIAAARRAEAHEFIEGLADPKGRRGLRRPRRRARREAERRATPAHRHRARDAEGRAHPAARRSHQRARQRGRERAIQAEPVSTDGRQDRGGDRAPPVDHRGDGPADGASTRAASSRRATTAACWRAAACTRACGRTRAAASWARMPKTTKSCRLLAPRRPADVRRSLEGACIESCSWHSWGC